MTYADQYTHPRWQKKRLEILNERGFRCECCHNAEKQLHIHHKKYIKDREVWEYENDGFLCLCKDCHGKRHELEKRISEAASNVSEAWLLRLLGYAESLPTISNRNPQPTTDNCFYLWGFCDITSEPPPNIGLAIVAEEK